MHFRSSIFAEANFKETFRIACVYNFLRLLGGRIFNSWHMYLSIWDFYSTYALSDFAMRALLFISILSFDIHNTNCSDNDINGVVWLGLHSKILEKDFKSEFCLLKLYIILTLTSFLLVSKRVSSPRECSSVMTIRILVILSRSWISLE